MKYLILVSTLLISLSSFAKDYECFGTEPFWGVSANDKTILYHDVVTDKDLVLNVTNKLNAAGYSEDVATVYKTKYSSLTIVAGECNDGMSDNEYKYHAVFNNGNTVFYGCCN